MIHKRLGLAVLAALALSGACATTKVKNVWVDPSAPQGVDSVLVVGASPDEGMRRLYEQTMTDRLRKAGVEATPSFRVLPEKPSREDVAASAQTGRYDAVVVARFAGERTEARVEAEPMYGYGYGPADYWYYGYNNYYVDFDEYVSIETRVFVPKGEEGALVWVGQTETWEPDDARDLIRGSVDKTVARLDKDGVI